MIVSCACITFFSFSSMFLFHSAIFVLLSVWFFSFDSSSTLLRINLQTTKSVCQLFFFFFLFLISRVRNKFLALIFKWCGEIYVEATKFHFGNIFYSFGWHGQVLCVSVSHNFLLFFFHCNRHLFAFSIGCLSATQQLYVCIFLFTIFWLHLLSALRIRKPCRYDDAIMLYTFLFFFHFGAKRNLFRLLHFHLCKLNSIGFYAICMNVFVCSIKYSCHVRRAHFTFYSNTNISLGQILWRLWAWCIRISNIIAMPFSANSEHK